MKLDFLNESSSMLWHKKLGHISKQRLMRLVKGGVWKTIYIYILIALKKNNLKLLVKQLQNNCTIFMVKYIPEKGHSKKTQSYTYLFEEFFP